MKKKTLIVMLVLLTLVLSGCACEHEWAQADCLNPQICTKCEEANGEALGHTWSAATCDQPETCTRCAETQGDPIGHDWSAASCTAPETCSRCAMTQGELLEHSFGSWTIGETDMSRTCEICSFNETTELDRELCLETLLPGYWEFFSVYYGGSFYTAEQLKAPGDSIQFNEDRSLSGMLNTEEYTGTWEFHSYVQQNENELYVFLTTGTDGRKFEMRLLRQSDADTLFVIFANGDQLILTRNDAVASRMIGNWGYTTDDGQEITLSFREDRTVTCVLNEEIEGTWHLTSVMEVGALKYSGLYIAYEQDGESVILEGIVLVGTGEDPVPYSISLNWNPQGTPDIATNLNPRR